MIGKTVSHYRIIEKLGGGGMGVVYKAEDLSLKRIVALKFLPPEMTRDADAKARFVSEAQAASAIDHPSICTIHEINDTEDGQMFIAMSHYGGESLKHRINQGPLGVEEAVRIATEAAEGLAKAHTSGIVHRDIKPANIMLTDDGHVKIVDFGLAKLAGQSRLTRTGTTMGTIAYMSPEQARGESVDARTDVWALGVVLHEMLVGGLPFRGDHEQALVYNILNTEPARVTEARRDVPVELERIVERAMEKRQEDRYPSMAQVVKDLHELSRRMASGDLRRRRLPFRLKRRQARVVGVAAAAALAVLIGGALLLWRTSVAAAAPVTIAVLPFRNMSGDKTDDFIAALVTDGLYTELLKIGRLKVASMGAVGKYAGAAAASMPELGRQLHVTWVIGGSVVRDRGSNRVAVSAWLTNAAKDEGLWAEKYNRDSGDLVSLQEEITRAIAAQIKVEIGPAGPAAALAPLSADANEAYNKGLFHAARFTAEALALSVDYFRKTIELAPHYAPAYAGLAHAYLLQGGTSAAALPPRESAEKATAAAQQALRIDKNLGAAHRVLGEIRRDYDWDFDAADAELTLARQAGVDDAGNAATLTQTARLRRLQGRYQEALDLALQAERLDTLDKGVSTVVALVYSATGKEKYPQSLDQLRKTLDFDGSFVPALEALGMVQISMGSWADAIASYEKAASLSPLDSIVKGRLAFAYAHAGRRADAEKVRAELEARSRDGYVPPASFALVAAGLGETGAALDWLEKAAAERSAMVPEIPLTAEWDSLRGEPRLAAILAKAGLRKP